MKVIPRLGTILCCLAGLATASAQSIYEPYSFTTLSTTGASLIFPKASAIDAAGNIYVANNDHTILKITPLGVAIAFAGQSGVFGSADGTGTAAQFTSPEGIAVDLATGYVYVSDSGSNTIRQITPAGVVTTFAGSPGPSGAVDGTGSAARFAHPKGLAVDNTGNIYVADSENYTIRKITPGRVVSTLAGLAGNEGFADGNGTAARFNNPKGIAVDGAGHVYVADGNNHIIRKITPSGTVSTLAGVPDSTGGSQDGQDCPRFHNPDGVAVDNNGNVFVADTSNSVIRKITAAGLVRTIGGKVGATGNADGVGSAARFFNPGGITLYSANQVLVTDTVNSTLRVGTPAPQPTPMNRVVTTTNDSGPGSLRQALNDAQSGDIVSFSSSLNGQTISLTSDQLTINDDISIIGPGANLLGVERSAMAGAAFRIFNIPPNRAVTISGLTIRNGNAHSASIDGGGAIYTEQSSVAVDRCMFINNTAAHGGALCNSGINGARGSLIVTNSTFQGNSATFAGGGIFNSRVPDGTSTPSLTFASVKNCTFSTNSATDRGGAICNYTGNFNRLDVANSTFNLNDAVNGTALYSTFASSSVGNSIFQGTGAGATVVKDASNPPFEDRGYNVLSDEPTNTLGAPLFGGATNQLNTDPRLGPLQDNGGPTLTHAPLVDSPAIDKGKDLALDVCNAPLAIDQRGFARPVRFNPAIPLPVGGDGSDSGAVELSGLAPALGNISTRLAAGTGENVLIGGFIIEGSAPKRVLIRARGPSLSSVLPNTLPNPRLELHDATSTIATNNDWQSTQIGGVITADQRQEIENSGLAPGNSAESAIIATLPAGNYTAIMQDVNGASGIGIVEVFDLAPNVFSRLANISTRGFVQTGDNVMIGGIIVVNQPTKVILRARGPSLAGVVSNPLPNPKLELHDQTSTLATNDDWQTTQTGGVISADQRQEIENSGFAPGNQAESAIIATLQPGAYTAIVQDANGASGIGLVEVFVLP